MEASVKEFKCQFGTDVPFILEANPAAILSVKDRPRQPANLCPRHGGARFAGRGVSIISIDRAFASARR
jgi:hypothetical protein